MRKLLLLLASLACLPLARAQQPAKKPLDHTVYDRWESVTSQKISNNGKYVLYQVKPQQATARSTSKPVATALYGR